MSNVRVPSKGESVLSVSARVDNRVPLRVTVSESGVSVPFVTESFDTRDFLARDPATGYDADALIIVTMERQLLFKAR